MPIPSQLCNQVVEPAEWFQRIDQRSKLYRLHPNLSRRVPMRTQTSNSDNSPISPRFLDANSQLITSEAWFNNEFVAKFPPNSLRRTHAMPHIAHLFPRRQSERCRVIDTVGSIILQRSRCGLFSPIRVSQRDRLGD